MKIRVTTNKYEYQGLYKGSEHDIGVFVTKRGGVEEVYFTHHGKKWALTKEDFEVVGVNPAESATIKENKDMVNSPSHYALFDDDCEEVFPAPNEKLLDVISTDLKREECRSSYCECEEGKCSGGKVDRRVDKTEKKESVLDIQHGGSHYKDKGIQPIEYITANNLGFCEGNIVKYASRHQDKNGAEDIRKVIHYAQFILKFQYNEDI